MATAYTVTIDSALPKHLIARVVIMRADGAALSPEDLEAAEAAYPAPPAEAKLLLGPKRRGATR